MFTGTRNWKIAEPAPGSTSLSNRGGASSSKPTRVSGSRVSVTGVEPSLTIASWSHSSVSNSALLHPLKNGAGAADPDAAGAEAAPDADGTDEAVADGRALEASAALDVALSP